MLMENHATGDKEKPLYHGSPELRVEEFEASKCILLAAPSPDREGKRIVGFLDGSVKVIEEADYQAQVEQQRKPPMERTIDTFLQSCAEKGVADNKAMFDALGMAEFIEQYGNGQSAMQEHHDQLAPVMRFAIAKGTGEPSAEFIKYVRSVHLATDSKHKAQAILLLRILGIAPGDGID